MSKLHQIPTDAIDAAAYNLRTTAGLMPGGTAAERCMTKFRTLRDELDRRHRDRLARLASAGAAR